MKVNYFIFSLLVFFNTSTVFSQQKINPDSIRAKMQWYEDAKLGIFIHWGIYAVNGVDESWGFYWAPAPPRGARRVTPLSAAIPRAAAARPPSGISATIGGA